MRYFNKCAILITYSDCISYNMGRRIHAGGRVCIRMIDFVKITILLQQMYKCICNKLSATVATFMPSTQVNAKPC